jgi:DNA-binding transcriptional regulator YiaG
MTHVMHVTSEYRNIQVGAYVKQLRQTLALTQYEFAKRLSVRPETINRWEMGKCKPLPIYLRLMRNIERTLE